MTETAQFDAYVPDLAPGSADPLLLDCPGVLWQVQSGQVDLFAVDLVKGRPSGRRHFLLRVEAGGLLPSLPVCDLEADRRIGFVAVGTLGARIARGRWDTMKDLDSKVFATLVDAWVKSASTLLGSTGERWPEQVAGDSAARPLAEGERLYGQPGRVCWLESEGADLELMGLPVERPSPLPVTGGTWVMARRETSLTCTSSRDLMRERRLGPTLETFHQVLVRLLAAVVQDRERALEERSLEREHKDREALGESLKDLATVIRPDRFQGPMESPGGSPFFRVCAEVARALGMDPTPGGCFGAQALHAQELSEVLRGSKLRHRSVLLRDTWWRRDSGPIVGYRKNHSPVALLPQGPGRYRMVDPARETSTLVDKEVAASLLPQADVLYRPFPDEPVSVGGLVRFGLQGVGGDLKRVFALGLASGLLALALPLATGMVIDKVLPRAAEDQLWQIAGGMLAAVVGIALFGFVQSLAVLRVEGRLDWSLQSAVFDRLLKLPAPFFRDYTTGDLTDRVLGIQAMRQLLSSAAISSLLGFVFSIFSFLLLFSYSVPLAAIVGLLVALSVVATVAMGIAFLRHERRRLQLQGVTEGLVLQLIVGADKLRVAAAAPRALAYWGRQYAALKRHQAQAGRWANGQSIFHGVYPILSNMVLYGAIIWLFNRQLSAPDMVQSASAPLSTGGYLAFNAAFGQFLGAMTGLALTLTEVLGIVPLHERSRPILEASPERSVGSRDPGVLRGQLELSSVSFRYAPELPLVLDGLDLQIQPGEFVAIVGASGSGKSTLLRLLLGFEQPLRGELFYDGKALSTLNIRAVRSQIGVVLQNGRIQVGSIFENIVGGVARNIEDAWRAARLAGLDADIEAMPMGMHTVLTADGRTLSGGQRQRLLIARALMNQPRILFLDEATSALDNRTQTVVTDTLAALNITRILIAHRLSTIREVDRIVVLKNGRIAEMGSYDELMSAQGVFRELASRQLL